MAKRGGFPGGGLGNMGAMMKQAQKMQAELAKAQEEVKTCRSRLRPVAAW